jgi:hypothetical protein
MDRMPDALPAVDAAATGNAMPSEVGRAAVVTYPFGTELESQAVAASLDHELVAMRRFPEFFVETVASRTRSGQSGRKTGFSIGCLAHRFICAK